MKLLLSCVAAAIFAASTPANAVLIAYWDQNSNALPTTGFGFTPASFPQAADQGAGSLSLADFDTTIDENSLDGAYDFIESFTGTTDNAQPDVASGGSLSPQGGTDTDGVFSNNGMSILLSVSTSGFEDITISWSQRGTSTGFQSRELLYSTNGVDFTSFGSDTGILGSSFATISYDLSAVSAIEDASSVTFAIKLDGAIGSTGNNRFDNITIEGTEVGIGPGGTIGDYNDDGFVDLLDLLAFNGEWSGNLGTMVPMGTLGDYDGSGTVDLLDLLSFNGDWSGNLGTPCP